MIWLHTGRQVRSSRAVQLAVRSLSQRATASRDGSRVQAGDDSEAVGPCLPPFAHDLTPKLTLPPNPSRTWGQKVDSTPDGREWMEGEKQGWKTLTTAQEDPAKLYALMTSGVVPRPIALVSTVSEHGIENLAPFSWFGMITHWPPVVAIACLHRPGGRLPKDTTANIARDTGFVVNLVSEPLVAHAHVTSIDCPPDVDEWTLSGLTKMPSIDVQPPRVKESAFSMECRLYQTVPIVGPASVSGASEVVTTTLILGHVTHIHVRKDVLTVAETVDIAKFRPIARLGDNAYARVGDTYKLARPSWATDEVEVRETIDKAQGGRK